MKDLIINSLELICKIAFVFLMLMGVLICFGAVTEGKAVAGVIIFIAIFIFGVLTFGGIFLLLEMNENLGAIRRSLEKAESKKI